MNKVLSLKVTIPLSILASIITAPTYVFGVAHSPNSKGDYPFPLPMGTITLNRGLQAGHDGHDFHLYHTNKNAETKADPNAGAINGSCLEYGIPILAVEPAEVVVANQTGYNGGMGTSVILKANGVQTMYMHMVENSLQVAKGEKVERGQLIGLMGSTGASQGNTCTLNKESPLTGQKEPVKVSGVHLHFEIRTEVDQVKYAHPVNSFIGQEVYTEMKANGKYVSTTKMYDPKGYWKEFGYRYDYVMPEDGVDYSGTWSPDYAPPASSSSSSQTETETKASGTAIVTNVSPRYTQVQGTTVYTITGENLPMNMKLDFPACNDLKWMGKRTSKKQEFVCTLELAGITGGTLKIADQKTLTNKPWQFEFDVKVLAQGEKMGKTTYNGFPKVPTSAKPGDVVRLSVEGNNLPLNLKFDVPMCAQTRLIYVGPQKQTIECKLATYAYDSRGNLKNEILAHGITITNDQGEVVAIGDLVLDHELKIESITPPVAYFGQTTSFTIKGKGVDKLKTFHLDYCQDLVVLSQSSLKNQVVIKCRLPVPEKFFSPLMPDILKRKTLNLHIKDKPGGKLILSGKIEAIAFPESWVNSIVPYYPALDKTTKFTISGNHLPDKLLYWMGYCGQGEMKLSLADYFTFSCKSEIIGGPEALKRIEQAALKAKENPQAFVKEIEKQKRLVEVKYPKEYSEDGKIAFTIYRGYVLPLPEKYKSLYLESIRDLQDQAPGALFLDENNSEDIVGYILNNPGNYSNTFLKKLGWKNTGSNKNPIYELLSCSKKLQKEGQAYGPKPALTSKLNTIGSCAKGLDVRLIDKELPKMYPTKEVK